VPRKPTKVGGLRSAASRDIQEEQPTALPDRKQGTYQFRSRASSLMLSLRRRRIVRGPDGEAVDEIPRSKQDSALDLVRFEDHSFVTTDPEVAKLIREKSGYGLGLEFWALDVEQKAHDKALEDELRRKIEERPDIAKRVLKVSEADDLAVPQR